MAAPARAVSQPPVTKVAGRDEVAGCAGTVGEVAMSGLAARATIRWRSACPKMKIERAGRFGVCGIAAEQRDEPDSLRAGFLSRRSPLAGYPWRYVSFVLGAMILAEAFF